MMRTLVLSTVVLGAWTAAALAEPAVTMPAPTSIVPTKIAPSQQAGRVELSDAQMDKLKAGGSAHFIFNNGNDFFEKENHNSFHCHNCPT